MIPLFVFGAISVWWHVLAVCIPFVFLTIILAMALQNKQNFQPKIIRVRRPINVVGFRIKTTEDKMFEDDYQLWHKFREIRDSIPNKEEEYSHVTIRCKSEEDGAFDFGIGAIVNDFSQVPEGMNTLTIDNGFYVAVHVKIPHSKLWMRNMLKAERFILEEWLPNSIYEVDPDNYVYEVEYHDKRVSKKKTRAIIFYLAVRQRADAYETKA